MGDKAAVIGRFEPAGRVDRPILGPLRRSPEPGPPPRQRQTGLRPAEQGSKRRPDEEIKTDETRGRIAGEPEDEAPPSPAGAREDAKPHRLPRLETDLVEDLLDATAAEGVGDEIEIARRHATGEEKDVGGEPLRDRRPERLRPIDDRAEGHRLATEGGDGRSEHRAVGIARLTESRQSIGRDKLAPRREDRHARPRHDHDMRRPRLGREPHRCRRQERAGREHLRACPKRTSLEADMLPGAKLRFDKPDDPTGMHPGRPLDGRLDRHHRIGSRRNRRPGHDPGAGAGADFEGRGIAGREIDDDIERHWRRAPPCSIDHVRGADSEAVHHGPVPRRGIDVGDDRLDELPSAPFLQPHAPRRKEAGIRHDMGQRRFEIDHRLFSGGSPPLQWDRGLEIQTVAAADERADGMAPEPTARKARRRS